MNTKDDKINVLVIGSGGREHAMVRKLLTSQMVKSVVCAPGNGGIQKDTTCVDIFAQTDIVNYCRRNEIGLVIVGPEEPLVQGLADRLREEKIPVFGPGEQGAQIEASKAFTKRLCEKYNIPTAKYAVFENALEACNYIKQQGVPIVVKADGLAGGKGVTVAMTLEEAYKAVVMCFEGMYGAAGHKVVIEEYLEGEEVSFFALCDGFTVTSFASAQDHKRAYDGDKGPNTGGMGSFSPTPLVTPEMEETIMTKIIKPTMQGLLDLVGSYTGVLFAGLMLTKTGPKLIEYNCRFGDPETQSILARYEGDLAALLLSCAKGSIDKSQVRLSDNVALCVVMAAKGYPGKYVKGSAIGGLDRASNLFGVHVLHAGTELVGEDNFISRGGRVLNIVATGGSLRQAHLRAYEAIDCIDWADGFCRRDIGAKVAQHK
jgi:phosphoribosylamine--glycine ligase